jgi:p21-activated kinase 1
MTTFNTHSNSPSFDIENQLSIWEKEAKTSSAAEVAQIALKAHSQPSNARKRPLNIAPIKLSAISTSAPTEERPKKMPRLPSIPLIAVPVATNHNKKMGSVIPDEEPQIAPTLKNSAHGYSEHILPNGHVYEKIKTAPGTTNLEGASKTKKSAYALNGENKVVVARLVSHKEEAFEKIKREFEVLSRFKGDRGIVQVYDIVQTPNKRGIPTLTVYEEDCNQGDVISYLSNNGNKLPRGAFPQLANDWISGLETMHSKGIAHRDIKSDNLLIHLDENGLSGKICDLDLCIDRNSGPCSFAGTANFNAPEKALAEYNDDPTWTAEKEITSDVWALGLNLYLLYSGQSVPWYHLPEEPKLELIASYARNQAEGSFFQEPDSFNDPTAHFIWRLCQFDPSKRPSMEEAKALWSQIPNDRKDLSAHSPKLSRSPTDFLKVISP